MITLSASADFGHSGQYVARITGRDSKYTFAREFLGRKGGKRGETTATDVDEPGLYETCDVTRKRGKVSRYALVIETAPDTLEEYSCDKEDAMRIAKALDAGRRFAEVVEGDADGWSYVTPRQAEQKAAAQTIDTATEACWAALQALPEAQAKKVLAALRQRVSPPRAAEDVGLSADAPAGVVADANLDAGVPAEQVGLAPTPVAEPAPETRTEEAPPC